MKPAAGAEKILVLFVTGNPRTEKSTPPGVGGCPQILMYLSYFGGFLKYLRENWPPIGGQKILSISVMFLEANSFRNSNPSKIFACGAII